MADKATTLQQQIAKLKSRGLIIDDEDKAKEVLADIGYYRLGFYWFPFETDKKAANRKHKFVAGASFKDAVDLYYFDYELRLILLKYITRIEVNLRTKLIYIVSNAYPTSPTWFADPAIVNSHYAYSFQQKQYKELLAHNTILKHHHKKYINNKYAPAWKTIEFMPLGAVQILYSQIRDLKIREQICQTFGVQYINVFDNYIDSVRNVRNACAHGKVVYDLHLSTGIRKGPAGKMVPGNNNSLRGAILVILFLLDSISANRSKDMRDEIKALEIKYRSILNKINFSCF